MPFNMNTLQGGQATSDMSLPLSCIQGCLSPSKSQMCFAYFHPLSTKFINSTPLFWQNLSISPLFEFNLHFFGLIYIFSLPLFWPWCIYASCFTCSGCPWLYPSDTLKNASSGPGTAILNGCYIIALNYSMTKPCLRRSFLWPKARW